MTKVKNEVTVKLMDGKEPAKTPWGLNVRCHSLVNVPPASDHAPGGAVLKLGLEVDRPLLCWLDPSLEQAGLETPQALWIALPNEELKVGLLNKNHTAFQLQEGQVIFKACPLDNGFDLVVKR